jgi:alpha 1,3-glucosidase
MVTIIDPHIKRDDGFSVYKEAKALDIFVKTKDKQEFEGHCWPGKSIFLLMFRLL